MNTTTRTLPERLHDSRLFHRCALRDRKIVARHLDVQRFAPHTTLARAGDPATYFLVVLDGELAAATSGGISPIAAGDFVGELGLLRDSTNHEDVTTTLTSEVAVLGTRMFHGFLRDSARFNRALMADLAERAATCQPSGQFPFARRAPSPRTAK